jgi:thiamine phosphate synthase YjbQ (UPF0047 family)
MIAVNRTGQDHGDAHLKRQVMGREVVVAITDGQLDFGTLEQKRVANEILYTLELD